MNAIEQSRDHLCRYCGAPLSADAAGEVCVRCALGNALEPPANTVPMRSGPVEEKDLLTVDQRVGRYKLLEKVGEGGCGVVYVAEQTAPVRRRVALKVIKLILPMSITFLKNLSLAVLAINQGLRA